MAKQQNFIKIMQNMYQVCCDFIRKHSFNQVLPNWLKKIIQKASVVLFSMFVFLFFYYFLGSQIAEDIDVQTQYLLPKKATAKMETAHVMNFLLKREVDHKMWTPNLPALFPAYVLDNMPNFQIGIVDAVRDTSAVLRRLEGITASQYDTLQQAGILLNYPPNVWLLSKKDTFNIAPSSNTQYRKAAQELKKFNELADFTPQTQHLPRFMTQMSRKLTKIVQKSEDYQQEHNTDILDFKSDDIFYYNCGYAFAMGQISRALGTDYKNEILQHNAYTDWTYLVSSLQKAAEFQPVVVRNGKPKDLLTPNHLMIQNFYLMRALAAIERIRTALATGAVDAN